MSDAKPQAIGLKGVGAPSCGFDAADTGRRMRAVLIGSAGNLIEWYDIYASSAFSLYFAGAFFPQFDPLAQQLAAASLFAAALGTVPLLTTLQHTKSRSRPFLLICAAWAIVSACTSIAAIVKAELFPTAVRAMGVGVPYALTVAIFGRSVDWVALNFKTPVSRRDSTGMRRSAFSSRSFATFSCAT